MWFGTVFSTTIMLMDDLIAGVQNGATAIGEAILHNHVEVISLLLLHPYLDINAPCLVSGHRMTVVLLASLFVLWHND